MARVGVRAGGAFSHLLAPGGTTKWQIVAQLVVHNSNIRIGTQ